MHFKIRCLLSIAHRKPLGPTFGLLGRFRGFQWTEQLPVLAESMNSESALSIMPKPTWEYVATFFLAEAWLFPVVWFWSHVLGKSRYIAIRFLFENHQITFSSKFEKKSFLIFTSDNWNFHQLFKAVNKLINLFCQINLAIQQYTSFLKLM